VRADSGQPGEPPGREQRAGLQQRTDPGARQDAGAGLGPDQRRERKKEAAKTTGETGVTETVAPVVKTSPDAATLALTVQARDDQIEALKQENTALAATVASLEKENEKLRKDLEEVQGWHKEARDEVAKLEKDGIQVRLPARHPRV
jgi:cell division protein FtsB